MVKLRSIFLVFLKLGALTFGGGLAMLPIIKKEICSRGWIKEDVFDDYIAVAQVAPGMIAINIATLVGLHLRRRKGAFVAVAGVALPSLFIIVLIATLLSNFSSILIIQKMLSGITLVVIILLTAAIVDIGKKTIKNFYLLGYSILSFVSVYFIGIPTTYVIAASIILGGIHTIASIRLGKKNVSKAY